LESKHANDELKSELEIKRRVIENLSSQLNKANSCSAFGRPKPIEEPQNMLNKSLFSNEPSFFVSQPTMTSTPSRPKALAQPKLPPMSADKEFKYDYKNR
jgi:hypothetical protein